MGRVLLKMEISKEALQAVPLQVFLDFAFYLKCDMVPSLPLEMWHQILLQCSDIKTALALLRVLPALQSVIDTTSVTYTQFLSKHIRVVKPEIWTYKMYIDSTEIVHIRRKWTMGHGFNVYFWNCNQYSAEYRTRLTKKQRLTVRIKGTERNYWLSQHRDEDDQEFFMILQKFLDRIVLFYHDNNHKDNKFDLFALQQFFLQHFPFSEFFPVNKLLQIIR